MKFTLELYATDFERSELKRIKAEFDNRVRFLSVRMFRYERQSYTTRMLKDLDKRRQEIITRVLERQEMQQFFNR